MSTIVTHETENYPVQPVDINTKDRFWSAFGNLETETSARWIVVLCQKNNDWRPLTEEEITSFYHARGQRGIFYFNGLIDTSYVWPVGEHVDTQKPIVRGSDGLIYITHEFISACFKSSPAFSVPEPSVA